MPFSEALLGFLGVLAGGVLTYLGVRFTARQTARAAETAAKVQDRQVDVEEWRAIVGTLRDEVSRLAERVEALEVKRDTDRILIDSLKAEAEIRIAAYRALVRYTRFLRHWATGVILDADLPPIPDALREDLEGPAP
jgi:hypothetical protein